MEQIFIQKIEHLKTGNELDLSFLKSFTFVETMDLSGPKLMVEFDDPHSWMKDVVGIKERDELRVTLADVYARDGVDEVMDFTILTRPVAGNSLKINAILKAVFSLKNPAIQSLLFTQKPASTILTRLFKGFRPNVGSFPVVEDYHIIAGERPTQMLRQMARESGAHIFVCREEICMQRLDDIMKKEADFKYYHDNPTKPNQIIQSTAPSSQHLLEDRIIKKYAGWNMTKGWISGGDKTSAMDIHSSASVLTLGRLGKAPRPAIDFTCTGNGFLTAGMGLDLIWETRRKEAPLDESQPGKVVVWTVAHHYSANKYFCRVKGVVPLEKMES